MKTKEKIKLLINELLSDRDIHSNYITYTIDDYLDEGKVYRLYFDNIITSNQFLFINTLHLNYYVRYSAYENKLILNIKYN